MPAAPRVLKAFILSVGRVVGVAGAQQVGGFGVVAAAGIQVADHQGDGRAGGAALIHAGEELHGVGLGAGGGKPIPAGAAAVHGRGNHGLIHRQARGQPVKHRPHGRSMALTKNRHTDGISKGVFHKVADSFYVCKREEIRESREKSPVGASSARPCPFAM